MTGLRNLSVKAVFRSVHFELREGKKAKNSFQTSCVHPSLYVTDVSSSSGCYSVTD